MLFEFQLQSLIYGFVLGEFRVFVLEIALGIDFFFVLLKNLVEMSSVVLPQGRTVKTQIRC